MWQSWHTPSISRVCFDQEKEGENVEEGDLTREAKVAEEDIENVQKVT